MRYNYFIEEKQSLSFKVMKDSSKLYEPSVAEKAEQHAKKEQRKKFRASKWREWYDDEEEEDDKDVAPPTDAKLQEVAESPFTILGDLTVSQRKDLYERASKVDEASGELCNVCHDTGVVRTKTGMMWPCDACRTEESKK